MNNSEEILKNVADIIEWYKYNHCGATGDQLLDKKDLLATYNVNLGEIVSDVCSDFNDNKYLRDTILIKSKSQKVKDGLAVNKAEIESRIENDKICQHTSELESLSDRYKRLLYQSNEVVKAMTQRIAILRKQHENM